MPPDPSHPSLLELDRFALGAPRRQTTEVHLKQCAQCTRYLQGLRPPESLPKWLDQVTSAPRTAPERSVAALPVWAWSAVALGVFACVSILTVQQFGRTPTPETYSGIKGDTAVGLYVRRQATVSMWDGKQPLWPNDRLRLRVNTETYQHANVFTMAAQKGSSAAGWLRLYSGRIARQRGGLLPVAWRVDDRPGVEVLLVVLAEGPISAKQLKPLLKHDGRTSGAWVRTYRIPKQKPR